MTNAERQRLFRERHPDYYSRMYQKRKAQFAARLAELETERTAAPVCTPLMLPAPVEELILPALNPQTARQRELSSHRVELCEPPLNG